MLIGDDVFAEGFTIREVARALYSLDNRCPGGSIRES
jgi:hypothetical protein